MNRRETRVRAIALHVGTAFGIVATLFLAQGRAVPVSAQAGTGTIRIAVSGTDAPGCGSVDVPCRTVQYAVNSANSGDTLLVAAGTFTSSTPCTTGSAVVCISNRTLTIAGGYSTSNWWTPNPSVNLTVFDGQNARRVVEIISEWPQQVNIRGITIQNGSATTAIDYTGQFIGGGLLCRISNPSIRQYINVSLTNVVFKNNRVQGSGNGSVAGGGAGFYLRCPATLQNVTFDSNQVIGGNTAENTRGAQALGGGLFATVESDVVASNITFTNNLAQAGSGGIGLGSDGSSRADGLGGGASIQVDAARLSRVTVIGNRAIGGDGSSQGGTGGGGGLFFEVNTSPVTVADAVIMSNTVVGGNSSAGSGGVAAGGGIESDGTILNLDRVTIVNNSSHGGNGIQSGTAGGGGMYFTKENPKYAGNVTGSNLVIADNQAEAGTGDQPWGGGGAIFNQDTELTLIHATIARNSVLKTMQAAGIVSLNNYGSSSVTVSYCIIAEHPGAIAVVIQKTGDVGSFSYTLFNNNGKDLDGTPGSNISDTNPVPTGEVRFMSPGPPNFNYHIRLSSAALDRAVGSTAVVDIDGQSRPDNGTSDVGADEYLPFPLSVTPLDTSLHLSWAQGAYILAGAVDHYEILVSCPGGANSPNEGSCDSPMNAGAMETFNLTGLTNFKPYTIVINARDSVGALIATSSNVTVSPTNILINLPLIFR